MNLDTIISNIYTQGIFFNPAWNHYNKEISVTCDRCNTTQLVSCLGWKNYDLCMKCVDELNKLNENNKSNKIILPPRDNILPIKHNEEPNDMGFMMQEIFNNKPIEPFEKALDNLKRSREEPFIVKNKLVDEKQNLTLMMQNIFKPFEQAMKNLNISREEPPKDMSYMMQTKFRKPSGDMTDMEQDMFGNDENKHRLKTRMQHQMYRK